MPMLSPGVIEDYNTLYVHSRTVFVRIRTEIKFLQLTLLNGLTIQMSEKVNWL